MYQIDMHYYLFNLIYETTSKTMGSARNGRLVTLIKTNKMLIKTNKSWQKVLFIFGVFTCSIY